MTKCIACERPSEPTRQGICPNCAAELDSYILSREAAEYEDMIRDMEMTTDNQCR